MFGRNLLPTLWREGDAAERRDVGHPFYGSIQKEMNRMFDDFFRGLDTTPFGEATFGKFSPAIDVGDSGKDVTVKVELPGMDEKDVEVLLAENALTIKGEKKEEKEDKGKDYYHMERTFGAFQRVIPLPPGIDHQKAEATFKQGVLNIVLPKTQDSKAKGHKISIKSE